MHMHSIASQDMPYFFEHRSLFYFTFTVATRISIRYYLTKDVRSFVRWNVSSSYKELRMQVLVGSAPWGGEFSR